MRPRCNKRPTLSPACDRDGRLKIKRPVTLLRRRQRSTNLIAPTGSVLAISSAHTNLSFGTAYPPTDSPPEKFYEIGCFKCVLKPLVDLQIL